ncbi:hypothetical protein [Flavisolibacter tropicus]|nr:hypothetical protein [Flavisolibacter tropicus]
MTKYLIGVLMTGILLSCKNKNTTTTTTESSPNLTNVENVNGNIPDTTNSISLENRQTVDSLSLADSLKNRR